MENWMDEIDEKRRREASEYEALKEKRLMKEREEARIIKEQKEKIFREWEPKIKAGLCEIAKHVWGPEKIIDESVSPKMKDKWRYLSQYDGDYASFVVYFEATEEKHEYSQLTTRIHDSFYFIGMDQTTFRSSSSNRFGREVFSGLSDEGLKEIMTFVYKNGCETYGEVFPSCAPTNYGRYRLLSLIRRDRMINPWE